MIFEREVIVHDEWIMLDWNDDSEEIPVVIDISEELRLKILEMQEVVKQNNLLRVSIADDTPVWSNLLWDGEKLRVDSSTLHVSDTCCWWTTYLSGTSTEIEADSIQMTELSPSGLSDHFISREVPAITVNVLTNGALDKIAHAFGCSTSEENEIILDCCKIQEQEEKERLAEILEIPTNTIFPVDGYIIFWR